MLMACPCPRSGALRTKLNHGRYFSRTTIVSSSVSDTNDPGDFADFASRNEDRITTESAQMLSPSDLVQLPKGQAFALIHGGQLHKLRMPLPDASHDPLMPASLEAIGAEIRARSDGHWNQPGAVLIRENEHGV